jgi:hypothetical protein
VSVAEPAADDAAASMTLGKSSLMDDIWLAIEELF